MTLIWFHKSFKFRIKFITVFDRNAQKQINNLLFSFHKISSIQFACLPFITFGKCFSISIKWVHQSACIRITYIFIACAMQNVCCFTSYFQNGMDMEKRQ